MIERYRRDIMYNLFTEENKFNAFLLVELFSLEAWNKLGKIPAVDVEKIQENAKFSVKRIKEIEKETRHDIVAFTRNISEYLGEEKKWVHYGLTSTDVVDTANGYIFKQANDILWDDLNQFQEVLKNQAIKYKSTPCIGRTHGVHADITSFGLKWALWYDEFSRHLTRFKQVREEVEIGKVEQLVILLTHHLKFKTMFVIN